MQPRYQVSRSAIELIKRFEGYRRSSAQLPDGRWTIGYGHTLTAREGVEVSERDAEALLIYDLIGISHSVNEWVFTPLNQNQFDALVAFAFNLGSENFRRSSVLRRLNEGDVIEAACAMELWRKAEFEGEIIVVDALVRRRSAEKTLFLTPMDGWRPAPSSILRPSVDLDVAGVVPRQSPTALTVRLDGDRTQVERLATQPAPSPEAAGDGPASLAAAAVSSRLATIFSDTVPPGPGQEMQERLILEEESPQAFRLTPPEEDDGPVLAVEAPPPEPVAANEAAPSLFDPPLEQAAPPEIAATLEDDATDAVEEPQLRPIPGTQARRGKTGGGFGAPAGLAAAGLALFGGGLFWAISMPRTSLGAGVEPATVVWIAGVLGLGLIGVAVYMILDRLGRPALEHVEATLERDE